MSAFLIGRRSLLENNTKNEPVTVTASPWKAKVMGRTFLVILVLLSIIFLVIFMNSFHKNQIGKNGQSPQTKFANDANGRISGTNAPPRFIQSSPNSRSSPTMVVPPNINLSPTGPNAPLPSGGGVLAPDQIRKTSLSGHNTHYQGELPPANSPAGGLLVPRGQAAGQVSQPREPAMSFQSFDESSGGSTGRSGSATAVQPRYTPGQMLPSPQPGGSSPLMASNGIHLPGFSGLTTAGGGGATASGSYNAQNDQSGKEKFIRNAEKKSRDAYLTAYPVKARSRYEIVPGTLIPGVLLTRLNSDTPGSVSARVAANVFNDRAGHHNEVLIPANTRIEGHYSSSVSMGQTRVQVAWDRLILPDQSTVELQGMSGTDSMGEAGFHDQVNNHYGKIFGAALVMSVFSAAAQLSQPMNGSALTSPTESQIAAGAVGQNLSMVGTQMTQQYMNIQPTLTVREGYPFNIYVNRIMIFRKPYKSY